jgi:7-cyano-7-deazaguanine synthase
MGLLSDSTILFSDQGDEFLALAQDTVSEALGRAMRIVTPLRQFTKHEVIVLARSKRLVGTYSCHAGKSQPCGECISCREFDMEETNGRKDK